MRNGYVRWIYTVSILLGGTSRTTDNAVPGSQLTIHQDKDHQSKYLPPTASQEAFATAKHTWNDMSVASLKEGLSTVAALATREGSLAAKEAYTRAPGVMSRYAATAREYVNLAVHGSRGGISKGLRSEAEEDGCSDWEPPRNEFTLPERTGGCSPSRSPHWESDPVGLRAPEKARGQGIKRLEYREEAGLETECRGQHPYRTKLKIGTTVEREDSCYDPLGVSSEWRRVQEIDERIKRRKKRVSEDWVKKVEKEYNPDRKHPRLNVGYEGVESKALARQVVNGFRERKKQSAEESGG